MTLATAITTGILFTNTANVATCYAVEKEAPEMKLRPMLDPNEAKEFKLQSVARVTHNTNRFRFVPWGDPTMSRSTFLNMPVASCITVQAEMNGETVVRPYTPVTLPNTVGHFDLVIKRYAQGIMSRHIHNLVVGDKLLVQGPFSKIPVTVNMKRELGLIAGGTGITPMYQVIQHVLQIPDDKTKLSLLFANVSPDDILLKSELDALAKQHSDRFRVTYKVDRVSEKDDWKGEVGRINKKMIERYLPRPSSVDDDSILIMVCGPPGMMQFVSGELTKDYTQGEVTGLLKEAGYSEKNVFKF